MSNQTLNTVIDKAAFEQVARLDKDLQGLYETFVKLYEVSLKVGKNPMAVKGAAQAKTQMSEMERAQRSLNSLKERAAIAETELGQKIAGTREQLRQQNVENKRAAIAANEQTGAYKRLSNQLNILRAKYKDVAASEGIASKGAQKLAAQVRTLDKNLKRIDGSVGQFQRSVGNYGTAFNGLAGSLRSLAGAFGFVGGIYLFANAIRDSFERVRQFDKAMQNIAGIMRVTRPEIADVEEEIKRVAGTSIKTSNEVAQLAENLVTLGKSKEEIIQLLKPVNDLAIGLETTSGEAAEFLVQMLNTFGASSVEAAKYADIIATIRTSTSLDFQNMVDSFQFLAPISRALGKDLAYTGSLVGILADNGIKAQRAGRLLGTAQLRLATQNITLEQALEKVNKSINSGASELQNATVASDLFGDEASALGLVLAQNSDIIDTNAEAIRNNAGALDDLTKQQLESLDAKLKILDSTWERFILNIENGEGPVSNFFKTAIEGATDLIEAFDNLNKTSKDFARDAETEGKDRGSKFVSETLSNDNLSDKEAAIEQYRLEKTNELNKAFADRRKLLNDLAIAERRVKEVTKEQQAGALGKFNVFKAYSVAGEEDGLIAANKALLENTIKLNKARGELVSLSEHSLGKIIQESDIDPSANTDSENESKKRADRILKESLALQRYRLEQEIEFNEEILDNEDENLMLRLEALDNFTDKSIELADLERTYALKDTELSADGKILIQEQYFNEVEKLRKQAADREAELTDLSEADLKKVMERNIALIETQASKEIIAENDLLRRKEITQEEHEQRVAKIKERYALEALEAQLTMIETLLNNEELSKDKRIDFERQVAAIREKMSDLQVEKNEENAEKRKLTEEELKEAIISISRDILSEIGSVFSAISDARQQRIEEDIQRNNDYYTNLLNNEELSLEQRAQLEAERDAKNAELEKKRREEQRKQAILNKAFALADIAINTAVNITKVAPNPILIALTAVLGAAQAATVLATPIPRYKTGKKKSDSYEGLALLNDGGRDEVRVSSDGSVERIKGRNIVGHVAKDDVIYPSEQAFNQALRQGEMDYLRQQLNQNGIMLSGAPNKGNQFDPRTMEASIQSAIKKGFKNVRISPNIINKIDDFDRYIKRDQQW